LKRALAAGASDFIPEEAAGEPGEKATPVLRPNSCRGSLSSRTGRGTQDEQPGGLSRKVAHETGAKIDEGI
jgi:hypothetical protein